MEWLNYHHLRYFWVVAREGSLSRASAELRLVPSTLSAQIQSLEEALGYQLFKRKGKRLELTETGHVVQRYADQIFKLGQEIQSELKLRSTADPPRFAVATLGIMPKLIIGVLLESILQLRVQPQLTLRSGKPTTLLAALISGELDVILATGPFGKYRGRKLFSHFLGESEVGIFGRPDLAVKYHEGFPRSLEQAPFWLQIANSPPRQSLDRWFKENEISPRVLGEFEDFTYLVIFAQMGSALFAYPVSAAEELHHRFGLKLVGTLPIIYSRYFAITAEESPKHPAVLAILDRAKRVTTSPPR
jgi:LysR family transcriptional regulator, transcriptional activator of nhaA